MGAYIGISANHVFELIRHGDPAVVRDRLNFLRSIELMAWVRPVSGNWFPGSYVDVLVREVDFFAPGTRKPLGRNRRTRSPNCLGDGHGGRSYC